jgi:hypothetical protein
VLSSNLVDFSNVVDRPRFDDDPDQDPNFHVDADPDPEPDPDWHQTLPILMRILSPSFTHLGKSKFSFCFLFAPLCKADCPLTARKQFVDFLSNHTQIFAREFSRIFYVTPVDLSYNDYSQLIKLAVASPNAHSHRCQMSDPVYTSKTDTPASKEDSALQSEHSVL